jgi:hypothetical protein
MSTVYLALSNNKEVLPSFKEKGAQNLMPGSVHDVPVYIEVDNFLITKN